MRYRTWSGAALLVALAAAAAGSAAGAGQELKVLTAAADVFAEPDLFADAAGAPLRYGDLVLVVEERGDWVRFSAWGPAGQPAALPRAGWLRKLAVTGADYQLASTAGDTGLEANEGTAAATGFNSRVEGEFLNRQPDLRGPMAEVDRIERQSVAGAVLRAFLQAGGLGGRGR